MEGITMELFENSKQTSYVDSLEQYSKDISEFAFLTYDEEVALGKRIANGDRAAIEELCNANYRLVMKIASKYKANKLSYEDLVQEGNIGLIEAAETYDYRRGCRFSTWATIWVRKAILKAMADQDRNIRIPENVYDAVNKMNRTVGELTVRLGHEPKYDEIAAAMGLSIDKVMELYTTYDTVSLDKPVGDDEDESSAGDFVPDVESINPEVNVINANLSSDLKSLLGRLSTQEQEILHLRFGLDGSGSRTLDETSKSSGINTQKVAAIERRALRKLRCMPDINFLKEYAA